MLSGEPLSNAGEQGGIFRLSHATDMSFTPTSIDTSGSSFVNLPEQRRRLQRPTNQTQFISLQEPGRNQTPRMEGEALQPEQSSDIIRLHTQIIIPGDDDIPDSYNPLNLSEELLEKISRGNQEVGRNREHFWNMLVSTMPRAGYEPPQGRQIQILDLACGGCEEGIVLRSYFGGANFGHWNEKARLIGIDIDNEAIERARQVYSTLNFVEGNAEWTPQAGYDFIHGDATQLDQYPQIPQQVDVAVIRHEYISENKRVWKAIFQQGLQRLTPQGRLLTTSYTDIEHEMLLNMLQELDCQVVLTQRNPYARDLNLPEVSRDRNIAVLKRK